MPVSFPIPTLFHLLSTSFSTSIEPFHFHFPPEGSRVFTIGCRDTARPVQVAESIGWPPGSPFQREVGMWDVAMGIVGLLCLKFRSEGYWTATIIGTGIFLIGAGLGHVYEMVANGTFAPNNAGAMMHIDLFYPLVLAGLLVMLHKKRKAGEDGGQPPEDRGIL
ncbi:hypothetical protein L1S32_08420 [Methanogenium sp. S4BF]|uniref:DUF6790 family protein n=1 Tax=Methanogenium sp. S4BF TaxID=1789226 RepID=UPI0024171310|nr:DUF6790 family protein [Methanogenium sp. S4BF]WFN33866.1 hypothetical protein L1S32_08420 [Methanogenium sp. S4BF]